MFCSCARPRADVNASVYILHNLHHTSRIEIIYWQAFWRRALCCPGRPWRAVSCHREVREWVWLFGAWGAGDRRVVAVSGCPVGLGPGRAVCVALHISLCWSWANFFWRFVLFIFGLEGGVMATPKRRSLLSFIFTCLCISKPLLIKIQLRYYT